MTEQEKSSYSLRYRDQTVVAIQYGAIIHDWAFRVVILHPVMLIRAGRQNTFSDHSCHPCSQCGCPVL
jgi:hypothetical protein